MVAPERWSRQSRRLHRRGFNEAGAWSPRKGGTRAAVPESGGGFNEAGAWSPRKVDAIGMRMVPLLASMRPGHGRPGKVASLKTPPVSIFRLQ